MCEFLPLDLPDHIFNDLSLENSQISVLNCMYKNFNCSIVCVPKTKVGDWPCIWQMNGLNVPLFVCGCVCSIQCGGDWKCDSTWLCICGHREKNLKALEKNYSQWFIVGSQFRERFFTLSILFYIHNFITCIIKCALNSFKNYALCWYWFDYTI